jgi:phosphoribosyl-ATP pyrophosphohydrolase
MKGDNAEMINEISDLIFHLFVLMAEMEIELDDVIVELQKRRMKRSSERWILPGRWALNVSLSQQ